MQDLGIRIDSVKVVLSGKELILNPEEAVKLKQAISDLPDSYPVYIDPNSEPFPDRWVILRTGMLGQTNVLTIHV